jgi:hypothetical protein
MSSVAFQFLTSLAGPIVSMKDMIQEYQKKREEKEKLKENLANSLQAEIKEYEEVSADLADLGKKLLPLLESIKDQPTPAQLMQFIDCGSQIPRILAEMIISFIHQARACKDISKQRGFMNSLLSSDRFMHDFIERMGETYVGKNTVRIDSSFFRFFLMYKREILKGSKIDKLSKKDEEFIKKRAELLMHGLTPQFLKRNMRMLPIKKWKGSLVMFNNAYKDMKIDTEGMDISSLNDFMPSGLKDISPFLDKTPPT